MTKRQRYTERTRPHRREPGESPVIGAGSGMNNPVVMIALGGLVLALVMVVAVFIGRSRAEVQTTPAAAPDPVVDATIGEPPDTGPDFAAPEPPLADDPSEGADPLAAMKQYAAPEEQNLDPETTAYFVTFETNKGTFEAELWPDLAPETVNSFVFLARDGYFDGLTFHRVEPGFVIQGGDPAGNGTGGPGYSLPAEFSDVPHLAGVLSMARTSDPNSAGSQFFVVLPPGPASNLDNEYAIFGYTYSGMDVVTAIRKGDTMDRVIITEKPKDESIVSPDDLRQGNLPDSE